MAKLTNGCFTFLDSILQWRSISDLSRWPDERSKLVMPVYPDVTAVQYKDKTI
nr:hypothetical protein [candidate division Zixibacteria bacterium]